MVTLSEVNALLRSESERDGREGWWWMLCIAQHSAEQGDFEAASRQTRDYFTWCAYVEGDRHDPFVGFEKG